MHYLLHVHNMHCYVAPVSYGICFITVCVQMKTMRVCIPVQVAVNVLM